jgi:cell division protein FtsB
MENTEQLTAEQERDLFEAAFNGCKVRIADLENALQKLEQENQRLLARITNLLDEY